MNMRSRAHGLGRALLPGLLLLAMSAPAAKAQVLYGSIVGTVQDASGGVIPGANVTITNRGTSQTRQASTDENGRYVFERAGRLLRLGRHGRWIQRLHRRKR
ncbi:MAG: carboxypeptidase-like regulatory domain-containing protein [Bryobacterales bacterium]